MIGKEVIPLNSLQPFVELDNTTKIFFAFFFGSPAIEWNQQIFSNHKVERKLRK